MIRLKMKNYDTILTKKQQKYHRFCRKELNISFIKYEYLTGREVLAFNQSQIIEQSIFTYSYEGKAFKNKQKRLEIKEKNDQEI